MISSNITCANLPPPKHAGVSIQLSQRATGAKQDHPLSFQLSSCNNLSPLQLSAGDTDCSPEGITIRLLFVPRINFHIVAENPNPVKLVTPRKNRITPQIPCFSTLSFLALEHLWSGGSRDTVGTEHNSP